MVTSPREDQTQKYASAQVKGPSPEEFVQNLFNVSTKPTLYGVFDPQSQSVKSMHSFMGDIFNSVALGIDDIRDVNVTSYIRVSGPGAEFVRVTYWPGNDTPHSTGTDLDQNNAGVIEFKGWNGFEFIDAPATRDANGGYWYRADIAWSTFKLTKPHTGLIFANTVRYEGEGPHPDFEIQAYTGTEYWNLSLEMLGRAGRLEFHGPKESRPTSGKLTLFDLTGAAETVLSFEDGLWEDDIFQVKLSGPELNLFFGSLDECSMKLKLTTGTYQLVGVVGLAHYLENNTWLFGGFGIILAWENGEIQTRFPIKKQITDGTTVIFSKHSSAKSSDKTQYDYGWWIEPRIRSTETYKAVTLLYDSLRKELALYDFPESDISFATPQELQTFKIASYNFEEINEALKSLYPKDYAEFSAFPQLMAQLIRKATSAYPSLHLGINSLGHGTYEGIMNRMIFDAGSIKPCFSLVQDVRKGKKIDFFDFSTNCNVASLRNMEGLTPYARYVLASDLTRNSPASSVYESPSEHYQKLFSKPKQNIKTVLCEIMDEYETAFNDPNVKKFYSTLPEDQKSEWKQQVVLFDCAKFAPISAEVGDAWTFRDAMDKLPKTETSIFYLEEGSYQADFKGLMKKIKPDYLAFEQDWDNFVIKRVTNRKTLEWNTDAPTGLLVT